MLLRAEASTYVLKPPANPSKKSKWVAEGEEPTAITDALDAEHRFAFVGPQLVEVAWSEDIRSFGLPHFEKLEKGVRMWAVLFVSSQKYCRFCAPAILQYEAAAAEFKDYVDFGAVDIVKQTDVTDWFKDRYGLVVDRVPMLQLFRPLVDRHAGKFEMLYYTLKIDRDVIINTFTNMMPSRILYPPPPADDLTCLEGAEVLRHWLSYDKPTLLALPLKTKQPPPFLRAISEDLVDHLVVNQITEELSEPCDFLVRRALRIASRPALVLVRPFTSFIPGDMSTFSHFSVPKHDIMSNGAFRRWLDRAWDKIGLADDVGVLESRLLIPKYVDPATLRTILAAEKKSHEDDAYNKRVDEDLAEQDERNAAAEKASSQTESGYERGEEETEEEVIDFRDEL